MGGGASLLAPAVALTHRQPGVWGWWLACWLLLLHMDMLVPLCGVLVGSVGLIGWLVHRQAVFPPASLQHLLAQLVGWLVGSLCFHPPHWWLVGWLVGWKDHCISTRLTATLAQLVVL